jgi:hypothetical protein
MPRARLIASALALALCLVAATAAGASAAVGISSAKAVSGPRSTAASAARVNKGGQKQQLTISTTTPSDGQTLSGSIGWAVSVAGGTPSRVDFAVDGSVRWSQATAPYEYGGSGGTLDTTKLADGAHTLSATAYGSRGVRATSTVTVTVANSSGEPEPAPSPEPDPASEPLPDTGPGGPVYWGAAIGSQLTGTPAPWDMSAVAKFEESTKRSLSLVHFFQPFSTCSGGTCSFSSFPWTPLENVRHYGAIPVVSWNSQSVPSSANEPDYQLSDIISGRYDAYIREWAGKAKQWGHPFFLRFDWEMNGNWFPWSEGVNGNRSGEFVAAWRHVHDLFAAVGATNVSWVWCPNIDWNGKFEAVDGEYPGDSYVDWIGLDGYNWGTNPSHSDSGHWQTFGQLYRSSYRYLVERVAPSKPLMIGEVASTEYGGSKAAWIEEMLTEIPAEYHAIRAVLWFDKYDSGMDWPIETSSTATSAFAESIQSSSYLGNSFSSLDGTPILPAVG